MLENLLDILPFLRKARFYFALVTVLIAFGPRFGVVLNPTEIAALNTLILAAFGVPEIAQGVVNTMAVRKYKELVKEQTSK